MRAQQLSKQASKFVPVFKVAADEGRHPPVGLDRPVCVVGRGGGANLPLPAPQVSKAHALIVRQQRGVYVRDLASTNGVELNGFPIRETVLRNTDIVRIGSYTLSCASGFGSRNGHGNGEAVPAAAAAAGNDSPPAAAPAAELRSGSARFAFRDSQQTLLIGRRGGCDVRLDHPSVAPVHAVLFELDGRRYVLAFDAPTGTALNGQPIYRQEIKPGDELRVGDVVLQYVAVAAVAGDAATPSETAFTGQIEPEIEIEPVHVIDAEVGMVRPAPPAIEHAPEPIEAALDQVVDAPAIAPDGPETALAREPGNASEVDQLSDIPPFDLGPVEDVAEPMPVIDDSFEQSLAAEVDWAAAAKAAEDDLLALATPPPAKPDDFGATLDEDDSLVSLAAATRAGEEDFGATLDEDDALMALAAPVTRASANDLGATLDEDDALVPLAVTPEDGEIQGRPSSSSNSNSQAAQLSELVLRAELADAQGGERKTPSSSSSQISER